MIIDAGSLIRGYAFIARRYRRVALCDPAAVQAACAQAAALSGGDLTLEPGALFFAFAEKRRAFPFAWKLMARNVAHSQARVNGFLLKMSNEELEALCVDVLYRRGSAEQVIERLKEQLTPLA